MLKSTSLTVAFLAAGLSASVFAQTIPDLGEAGQFSVLAGSTVTNTGSTIVTGELGVSPGTAITGFPPGIVRLGERRSNDNVASQAVADLLDAYNDLAGQPVDTEQATALGMGMVLIPGVYHFTDAADITGSLVLDAQNDSRAVFVFQIEEALTVASNAEVTLINGASAARVFWQTGTSATLGTGSRFSGSILAGAGITLNSGAVLDGRALAQTAVTLDSNTVTISAAAGEETPPDEQTPPDEETPTDEQTPPDEETPTDEQTPPDEETPTGEEAPPSITDLPELAQVLTQAGEPSSASIRAGSSSDGGTTYTDRFTSNKTITISARLFPEARHVGQAAEIFIVARHLAVNGVEVWAFKDQAGAFRDWDERVEAVQAAYRSDNMPASVSGEVYAGLLAAGDYEIYVGYAAEGGTMIYSEPPMMFTVTEE